MGRRKLWKAKLIVKHRQRGGVVRGTRIIDVADVLINEASSTTQSNLGPTETVASCTQQSLSDHSQEVNSPASEGDIGYVFNINV